jgi:hypothetical protein
VTAQATDPVVVTVAPKTAEIGFWETKLFTANVTGATNKNVTWTVEPATGAGSINSNGLYTAPATEVTCTVRATSEADPTKSDTAAVTVAKKKVTDVTFDNTTLDIVTGGSATIQATLTPADATDLTLNWSSSAPTVASVSTEITSTSPATVTIRGLTQGTATITATSPDGPTRTCTVTVADKSVTGVSLQPALTVGPGRTKTLTATLTPADATDKGVTWSTNNAHATVTGTGLTTTVTGVSVGTTTVTVRTNDGNHTDTCTVTVSDVVEPVVYVVGDFGLYVDGVFDDGTIGLGLWDVKVDSHGVVHATGYYDAGYWEYWPIHYHDGSYDILPTTVPDTWESLGRAISVSDGHVYIAGYEYTENPDESYKVARLWTDGEQVPLEHATNEYFSEAYDVRVHGGVAYICGSASLFGRTRPIVWKGGDAFVVVDQFGELQETPVQMAFDSNGVLYLRSDRDRLYRGDPETGFEQFGPENDIDVCSLFIDGTDVYVAGWLGSDAVYWKNEDWENPVILPRDDESSWAEARAIFVHNGTVYVAGRQWVESMGYLTLWRDGEIEMTEIFDTIEDATPEAIFVK